MRLVRNLDGLTDELRGGALAIGNFDGLHLGHRAVLDAMLKRAHALGVAPAVMSFEPHPRMFFTPDHAPLRVEPLHTKLRRLREVGVEILYLLPFNAALSCMSADDFVSGILENTLRVAQVVTGEGFVFGHKRGGNRTTLEQAAEAGTFHYAAVPPLTVHGEACSSSRIRAHLAAGEMPEAAALLGRPHEISGRVMHGAARGRQLGTPTANLLPSAIFLPRLGVYAVRYTLAHEHGWREGVANLGTRPSFGGGAVGLEVHGFAEDRDLYGKRLRVQLLHCLREERTFATPDALKHQISHDISAAKELLALC